MKTISMKKFFHYFCQDGCDKHFCFILGAGASMQSGIPGGSTLAYQWIQEIKESDEDDYRQWVQSRNIDTSKPAQYYSQIFDKRFELDIQVGHQFLRSIMENKDPSCGYSIIAQILANTKNNVVITTNFDNLIEDSMFIYSSKRPIVIGHEYLSEFIQARTSQPIIVKIHRDLYLAPKNSESNTRVLNESMRKQLSHILRNYTPIVIGYGANDGSLIDFLDELKPQDINGGMFWCSVPPEILHDKVKRVIEKCNGFEIKIEGFDEFMINLGNEMGFRRLDQIIMDNALRRAEHYRSQVWKIKNKLQPSSGINQAITNIIKRSKTDWWTYETEVASTTNIDEKEKIYQKGLEETHNCPELLVNYAVFLKNIRKDINKAEQYYMKALDLYPKNSDVLGNYATFLWEIKNNTKLANTYYKKALEEDSSNVHVLGNYAIFLEEVLHDFDTAEKCYKKALEQQPSNVKLLSNYATFLSEIRQEYEQAEEFYKQALAIDPTNLPNLGNYAKLLLEMGHPKEARKYINIAFVENEKHPMESLELEICFYALAVFPSDYPGIEERIEALLDKGVQSVGWNLQPILDIAKANHHPGYKQLETFARRITEPKQKTR